jgi:hypothetical protein
MVGGLHTANNSVKPKCLPQAQYRHFGYAARRWWEINRNELNFMRRRKINVKRLEIHEKK